MLVARVLQEEWLTADASAAVSIYIDEKERLETSRPDSPLRVSQVAAMSENPMVAVDADNRLRRSFMANGNPLISIEGAIAARKTTLGLSLKTIGGSVVRFFSEPASRGNEMLSFFYANPDLWAVPMQFNALRLRFIITLEVMVAMKEAAARGSAAIFVVERAWPGDWAFMVANLLMGRFSEPNPNDPEAPSKSLLDYTELMETAWRTLFLPNLTVYIDISPEESHERIKARGRGCEVARSSFVCGPCLGKPEPTLAEGAPGVVNVVCDVCKKEVLAEDGPIPLSYLRVLAEAQKMLQNEVVDRGYRWSSVHGHDNFDANEFLNTVDSFADARRVADFDVQIKALEHLVERATELYIKHLGAVGYTREMILEGHKAYLEREDARTGGHADES